MDMRVAHDKILVGDILVFKRKGFISGVLGWVLWLVERRWDRWGWHMGVAWMASKHQNSRWILEGTSDGVRVGLLSEDKLKTEIRAYRWLDNPPSDEVMEEFMARTLDEGYDVWVYLWTFCQRLQRWVLRHLRLPRSLWLLPRIRNRRYTCWELAFYFARKMGKPIGDIDRYPVLTDFLKAVQVRSDERESSASGE